MHYATDCARVPDASLGKEAFIEVRMDGKISVRNQGCDMEVRESILEKYFRSIL